MMSNPAKSWPWRDVGLAVLPGIILLLGTMLPEPALFRQGGAYLFFIAVLLVSTGAYMVRRGHVPVWGLPLLGLLAHTAVMLGLSGWINLSTAPTSLIFAARLWWLAPLGALPVAAMVWAVRKNSRARLVLVGAAALTLAEIGLSNSLGGGATERPLTLFLWPLGWLVIYPLLGKPLARRYGAVSVLFVLGAASGFVTWVVLDPSVLYSIVLYPVLRSAFTAVCLVLAPILVLRAGSTRGVWVSALAPTLLTLLAGVLAIAAMGNFSPARVVLLVVRVLQMEAVLGLALALYSTAQRPADPAESPLTGEMANEGRSA